MAIESVQSIQPMQALEALKGMTAPVEETKEETSFSNILSQAISKAAETEAIDETGMANLLAGEDVELHTGMIESTNATLALNLAIQVRNKVIEAYNEIIRMQV